MIITISGTPGSGKSTIAKAIAKEFKLKFISMGDILGEIAKKKNITLNQLQEIMEVDKKTDNEIDQMQIDYAKKNANIALDSRLGFHFIPNSLKIFVKVSVEEAARRIHNDPRDDEVQAADIEETENLIHRRIESERIRYKKYYNIDIDDESNYDLVIDTTKLTAVQAIKKATDYIKKNQTNK